MHVLRYGAESRLNVLRKVMHVLRYGAKGVAETSRQWIREPSQCIKMHVLRYGVNVLSYVMHVLRYGVGCFRHCATIFEKIQKFFGSPRPRV